MGKLWGAELKISKLKLALSGRSSAHIRALLKAIAKMAVVNFLRNIVHTKHQNKVQNTSSRAIGFKSMGHAMSSRTPPYTTLPDLDENPLFSHLVADWHFKTLQWGRRKLQIPHWESSNAIAWLAQRLWFFLPLLSAVLIWTVPLISTCF